MSERMIAGWCIALLGMLLVAGCGVDAPSIVIVYGDPESTKLTVGVDTCNRHPLVNAAETTEEVRLTVTADEPSGDGGEDCRDSVDLNLETPLGDRIVVDDSTNEQVEVAPLED
ncbi:MAG: hypothetical protein LH645_02675 [Actinomycetia bacterium]|nr:hypothetical protein [Actinomycetes bacterium]